MGTQTIQVNCTTRPIRLAFVLQDYDPDRLEELFRLNTLLWGGSYNPIVVLGEGDENSVSQSHLTDQIEIIEAFDPDFIVNCGIRNLPANLSPFRNRTLSLGQLKPPFESALRRVPALEVSAFLAHHWREDTRFLQSTQEIYSYLDLESTGVHRPFAVARFGAYPKHSNMNEILGRYFNAKQIKYDEDFRRSYSREWIFPMGITDFELDLTGLRDRNYALLLLDPINLRDVVEYWNLRAAGYDVFPLPRDHYMEYTNAVKEFIPFWIARDLSTAHPWGELLVTRGVEADLHADVRVWLSGLGVDAGQIVTTIWVPRFCGSERILPPSPSKQVRIAISKSSTEIVVLNDGYGHCRLPGPDCEMNSANCEQYWATELRTFDTTDTQHSFRLPWLHSECDALVGTIIGTSGVHSRVSQSGIVTFQRGEVENIGITEPEVMKVLSAYLRDGGFQRVKVSTAGLTLERIIEQLRGLIGCQLLQNQGVREIIRKLGNGSRSPRNDLIRMLKQHLPENSESGAAEAILSQMVDLAVLRQGFALQCTRCRMWEWYPLIDLGTDFRCRKCFNVQRVPDLYTLPICYVADGLFLSRNKVAGSLTSILSLLFLSWFFGHGIKYAPSFEYSFEEFTGERDFAVFVSRFFEGDVDVLIGECKSSRNIKENQRKAIREMGQRTGSYLVFSTALGKFSNDDLGYFRELVNCGIKPILLTSKHFGMNEIDVDSYRMDYESWGREAELLSRITIAEVLGNEFANRVGLAVEPRAGRRNEGA
jgi:hypothetical protein